MKLEIDLTGYEKLLNTLSTTEVETLLDAIELEIEDTAALVFSESQLEVPVDTGLLKSTGKIQPIQRNDDGIETAITYTTDYALWVHERLEIRHKPPTKAKYLEDPMKRHSGFFAASLKDIIETYFGGEKA